MIKIVDNIILVGTSHVAKQSVKQIKEVVDQYSPEVVAIELDTDRLNTLLMDDKDKKKAMKNKYKLRKEVGMFGFLFAKIAGYVQEKVGDSLGIEPGVDMKTAYETAREKKIPIALIDLNIKLTLRKLSSLKFSKKMKMFFNLFAKSFKKEYRDKLNFDVKKGVPDEKIISEMIGIVKKEVPDLYKILIGDRNIHMSERLLKLREEHSGYIVAVVGAGHVDGMIKILNKRLESNNNTLNQVSFSFNIE